MTSEIIILGSVFLIIMIFSFFRKGYSFDLRKKEQKNARRRSTD